MFYKIVSNFFFTYIALGFLTSLTSQAYALQQEECIKKDSSQDLRKKRSYEDPGATQTKITSLPQEVALHILDNLEYEELGPLASTCRDLAKLAAHSSRWTKVASQIKEDYAPGTPLDRDAIITHLLRVRLTILEKPEEINQFYKRFPRLKNAPRVVYKKDIDRLFEHLWVDEGLRCGPKDYFNHRVLKRESFAIGFMLEHLMQDPTLKQDSKEKYEEWCSIIHSLREGDNEIAFRHIHDAIRTEYGYSIVPSLKLMYKTLCSTILDKGNTSAHDFWLSHLTTKDEEAGVTKIEKYDKKDIRRLKAADSFLDYCASQGYSWAIIKKIRYHHSYSFCVPYQPDQEREFIEKFAEQNNIDALHLKKDGLFEGLYGYARNPRDARAVLEKLLNLEIEKIRLYNGTVERKIDKLIIEKFEGLYRGTYPYQDCKNEYQAIRFAVDHPGPKKKLLDHVKTAYPQIYGVLIDGLSERGEKDVTKQKFTQSYGKFLSSLYYKSLLDSEKFRTIQSEEAQNKFLDEHIKRGNKDAISLRYVRTVKQDILYNEGSDVDRKEQDTQFLVELVKQGNPYAFRLLYLCLYLNKGDNNTVWKGYEHVGALKGIRTCLNEFV